MAKPGYVVIAQITHRLLGDLFEYRNLGGVELKGFAALVSAWKVLGERCPRESFGSVRSTAELTPLVGRDAEVAIRPAWLELMSPTRQHVRRPRLALTRANCYCAGSCSTIVPLPDRSTVKGGTGNYAKFAASNASRSVCSRDWKSFVMKVPRRATAMSPLFNRLRKRQSVESSTCSSFPTA